MIRTRFDTETENGVPQLVLAPKLISHKIQDGGATILKITFLAIYWCIYLHRIWYRGWKRSPAARFNVKIHCKNPRWRRRPFWNQLNGHNSAIFERICTKFEIEDKNGVLVQDLSSKLTSATAKIHRGSCHHFVISRRMITTPILNRFAPNLTETGSQILKHARSAKQTTQGYRFFSKTANIIYKKTATIYLMLYKRW